ncbi:2-methoxy-6-polyprenyl-1,4-benzoquinol methylase [subsurface metagenome]
MSKEKKLEPMPDAGFKCMMWFFKLVDLFWNPQKQVKKFPLKEGMTVVDYGCGPGRYTIPIAKLVGEKGKVFALDIQPIAISTVNKKAAKEGLTNIEAILLDSYDTGIQEATVDLVLLIDTFHMISDYDALFREIHRILKQDGFLFMDPGHMKMPQAREIVESSDLFTIVECRGRDMLVAPKTEQ